MDSQNTFFDIRNFTFGKSTAESEIHSLNKYFVSTPTYLSAKNDNLRKVFYVGHRGAGKSALFNQLIYEYEESQNFILLSITPEEYSYGIFKNIEHDFFDMKAIYGVVWHFTLMVALFKATLSFFEKKKNIKKHKESIKIIKGYLEENSLLEGENGIKTLIKYLKKFDVSKIGINVSHIKLNELYEDDEQKLLNLFQMEEIRRPLKAFKEIIEKYPAFVFIDELDTGWDNSVESHHFIYGLFYAVNKLKKVNNLNIFLSLRKDMYNNLPILYTDAEKIRDDIEVIHWSHDNLKALIGYRIMNFLPQNISRHYLYHQAIDIIFEDEVLDYIIEHTLHRPREVIQFCNESLDKLKNSRFLNLSSLNRISFEIINLVEMDFYQARIGELCEEYKYQYPNMRDFLNLFEDALEEYSYNDFIYYLLSKVLIYDKTNHEKWAEHYKENIEELAKDLYEMGFIKILGLPFTKYYAYYEVSFNSFKSLENIRIHKLFYTALKPKNK